MLLTSLAFNIVGLGPVVFLELCEVERTLPLITHIIFTHVRFFLRRRRSFYFEKATRFCREVLKFFSISLVKLLFIAPFVPSSTT